MPKGRGRRGTVGSLLRAIGIEPMTNRLLENVTESQTTTVDCATTAPSPVGEKGQYIFAPRSTTSLNINRIQKQHCRQSKVMYRTNLDNQKCLNKYSRLSHNILR